MAWASSGTVANRAWRSREATQSYHDFHILCPSRATPRSRDHIGEKFTRDGLSPEPGGLRPRELRSPDATNRPKSEVFPCPPSNAALSGRQTLEGPKSADHGPAKRGPAPPVAGDGRRPGQGRQKICGDLTTRGGATSAGLIWRALSWDGDGIGCDHCGRVRGGYFEFFVALRVAAGTTLFGVSRGHVA